MVVSAGGLRTLDPMIKVMFSELGREYTYASIATFRACGPVHLRFLVCGRAAVPTDASGQPDV